MKTIIKILTIMFCVVGNLTANELNYKLGITNINVVSGTNVEFDIVLKNQQSGEFKYIAGQYFIEVNGIALDSKDLSCTMLKSDLPQELQPVNSKISGNVIMLAGNKIFSDKSFTVSDKEILIAKVQITGSNFGSTEKINLQWTNEKSKFRTKLVSEIGNVKTEVTNSKNHHSVSDKLTNNLLSTDLSIPDKFELMQNYPNPFNPETKIKFEIPANINSQLRDVRLILYDVTGRELMKLVDEKLDAGVYEVKFDGSYFASGVYFYKIIAGEFISTKRMVLLK